MKISLRTLASVAALAGSLALVSTQSGCSATATRQSTGEYVDDAAITTKVKTALVRDPVVSAFDVGVDTFKGTVQLHGFVDTPEQKAQAERIAATVNGVQSVRNNLSVKTQINQPGQQGAQQR